MIAPVEIPLPHVLDLEYVICDSCGHGYQNEFDRGILENIYKQHYYTPSPDNVGVVFRNEFIDFFKENIKVSPSASIFEVGCSSGDVLAALQKEYPQYLLKAIEPNIETALVAKNKGFDVQHEFFTQAYTNTLNTSVDIIYSRHVIEHIFDFADFFSAADNISHHNSQLILETPSLDWSAEHGSVMPFHVEHVHVFSERSLVSLAGRYGWYKNKSIVTSSGNLIVIFIRQENHFVLPPAPENFIRIQNRHTELISEAQQFCQDKNVVFWGAGSGAITLLALSQVTPEYIVDGNPNKTGKFFCGLDKSIGYAPNIISELVRQGKDIEMMMVISSSFFIEITQELMKLGWRGDIYSPYQNKT